MNDKNHICKDDFDLFIQGRMDQNQTIAFLEHIGSCNFCADQLEVHMALDMLPAPRNFKDDLLSATKRPEIQLARKAQETSKKMQLLFYSLKVGTAAVGAILLLFLTMNLPGMHDVPKEQPANRWSDNSFSLTDTLRDNMYKISDNMLDFSNDIINMEVIKNDKKEK
jgi:hypothetical protein